MALRKHDPPLRIVKSSSLPNRVKEKVQPADIAAEGKIDVDLKEVYFLIMHFLSTGPCQRTFGQLWNELLEHQLLPRRYHAWYSRSGAPSGNEDDDGRSFPLNYSMMIQRYSFIERDHLVKLLKQLVLNASLSPRGSQGDNLFNAAVVPTLLGTGSFSLLSGDQSKTKVEVQHPPHYLRFPHMHADQVRGLSLREIGGGFTRHHRAPSTRGACYAIAKPSTMVQKMQNKKIVRGHRYAVYCAIIDRSGRFVITGSDDRLVKIWSMETAHCLASCRGHEGDITDLAVNINNTLVASSSNDCIIRVWRLPDGLPISVLRGHTGAVTAIAFCPRPTAVYQLLSSSDDGSCRIWDARSSHFTPRVYVPKPSDSPAGRSNGPSSSTAQHSHQISCCAFNANGTVFVTGSSDTFARVWSACKSSTDDTEQPIHELDILAGHENDVNYVQFSGCAVVSRIPVPEALKEDNLPKFKNTSYNHDNIVTCSRDGSAIIWVPRSRRSHGKAGRWVRAYHLKVPPPPMPPQPPRGGPRQRILPTPRGVNMIVWSLDNRFVLAAIMDCRICVWNAGDGSLVHSLTGHTESTYVLDVHPFNPRIAMSAGYDGKTIVWDIWEGMPIRIYEIGHFRLVDGKFSPDGTSIILSDDVGQLYILSTGEGELQKDSKYDQFFLGDYRPLIQDTHGNVLDQETQLVPYRRNMQDLLCDSAIIPYPEPYQSMFQQRRLGALGIEWHPSSVKFAVGADITLDQEYQILPIADLDMLLEPLPDFTEVMNWEPGLEIHSDANDSEYNVTEEESAGEEQGSLGSRSSGESESSGEDSLTEHTHEDRLRRSRRRKKKAEAEIMTSSGRRVKRKNLDDCDGSSIRSSHGRKLTRKRSKKSSLSSKSLRPQRAAARNALSFFSRINGTSKDGVDDSSCGESSESESTMQGSDILSEESDFSVQHEHEDRLKGKEICVEESVAADNSHELPKIQTDAKSRRLVLKLSKHPQNSFMKFHNLPGQEGSSDAVPSVGETFRDPCANRAYGNVDLLGGSKDGKICWGGAKSRTSKRVRMVEPSSPAAYAGSSSVHDEQGRTDNSANGHATSVDFEALQPGSGIQDQEGLLHILVNTGEHGNISFLRGENQVIHLTHSDTQDSSAKFNSGIDELVVHSGYDNQGLVDHQSLEESFKPAPTKLKINSNVQSRVESPFMEPKFSLDSASQDPQNTIPEIVDMGKDFTFDFPKGEVTDASNLDTAGHDGMQGLDTSAGSMPPELVTQSETLQSNDRMFSTVYRRLKTRNGRNDALGGTGSTELNTSVVSNPNLNEGTETTVEGVRRTRSIRVRSSTRNCNGTPGTISEGISDTKRDSTSRNGKISLEEQGLDTRSSVVLRSTRKRRGSYNVCETRPPDQKRSNHLIRSSWLMLSSHEEGSRYIPQLGDEVAYLRQGHQEYIDVSRLRDAGPWRTIKGNIRAVEFCRVSSLEYSTISGSGESGCKLILEFIDPSSEVVGKIFKLTLPELADFPDFIVLKSRYDASIERNWTTRDKCQVWWKNEGEEAGSWWEGRIVGVIAKSPDFPDSPWERYSVSYRTAPKEIHQHSPWELYDASNMRWEPPHVDDEIRDKLLSILARLERSGNKAQDYYGIGKLKEVSEKISFINRYPVPLSLDVIQTRLENNYYRSLEAVKHDIDVLVSIAQSHFSKNAEYSKKTKRLSDWFSQTLKSL